MQVVEGNEMNLRSWFGFLRSLLIYSNPQRQVVWRRFYKQNLRAGDIVFDVGTHVGSRARAMRAAGAKVIAFEPQQPFTRFLSWTLPSDVTLVAAALGGTETEAQLAVSSLHPTLSSMRTSFASEAANAPGFEHVRWDGQQKVRVVILDSQIRKYGTPSYIKIDVEGFELEVLSGLTKPIEMLSVEYLPGFPALTHAVVERIEELGNYRFNPVVGEKAKFLWPEWRDSDAVKLWLESQPADASSGDLFALLESEPS
jgi:FkbM family methyltransferase